MKRKPCPYKDRGHLIYLIERRRNGLERAIAVYMEEVHGVKAVFIISEKIQNLVGKNATLQIKIVTLG